MRPMSRVVMFVITGLPSALALANGTHKRPARSELNAEVTCTKKDQSTVKARVLGERLKDWLVRVSDGGKLIAQDITAIDVSSVDSKRHLIRAKVTFAKGGSSSEELRATSVVGTDDNDQDRTIVLAECKNIAIVTEEPPALQSRGPALKK